MSVLKIKIQVNKCTTKMSLFYFNFFFRTEVSWHYTEQMGKNNNNKKKSRILEISL